MGWFSGPCCAFWRRAPHPGHRRPRKPESPAWQTADCRSSAGPCSRRCRWTLRQNRRRCWGLRWVRRPRFRSGCPGQCRDARPAWQSGVAGLAVDGVIGLVEAESTAFFSASRAAFRSSALARPASGSLCVGNSLADGSSAVRRVPCSGPSSWFPESGRSAQWYHRPFPGRQPQPADSALRCPQSAGWHSGCWQPSWRLPVSRQPASRTLPL